MIVLIGNNGDNSLRMVRKNNGQEKRIICGRL